MSALLKSCQRTTFGLIIVRAKLIKLLMPYDNTFSKVSRKKNPPSQKYKDLALIIIFINIDLLVEYFKIEKYSLSFVPSFHL